MKVILYVLLLLAMAGCLAPAKLPTEANALKRIKSLDESSRNEINSLLAMIEEQMAMTDPRAKRYIPYEFRIAIDAKMKRRVHRMDPSLSFTRRKEYYLCIGENATKERVYQAVNLLYTYRIRFCPYE